MRKKLTPWNPLYVHRTEYSIEEKRVLSLFGLIHAQFILIDIHWVVILKWMYQMSYFQFIIIRWCLLCILNFFSFNYHEYYAMEVFPILLIKKWRLWEIKYLAGGHSLKWGQQYSSGIFLNAKSHALVKASAYISKEVGKPILKVLNIIASACPKFISKLDYVPCAC